MKRFFFVLLALLPAVSALAGREVYDIGRGWKFYTVDRRDSVGVTLPHTWNDTDAAVGRLDYYRGIGNYFRYLKARPEWRGKRVFVRFYGAGTVADLMVNGRHAGEHRGGNNAFEFEITDLLDYGGKNLLWVIVNNGARLDVLPTAGEENVYGGLFRHRLRRLRRLRGAFCHGMCGHAPGIGQRRSDGECSGQPPRAA